MTDLFYFSPLLLNADVLANGVKEEPVDCPPGLAEFAYKENQVYF